MQLSAHILIVSNSCLRSRIGGASIANAGPARSCCQQRCSLRGLGLLCAYLHQSFLSHMLVTVGLLRQASGIRSTCCRRSYRCSWQHSRSALGPSRRSEQRT